MCSQSIPKDGNKRTTNITQGRSKHYPKVTLIKAYNEGVCFVSSSKKIGSQKGQGQSIYYVTQSWKYPEVYIKLEEKG